MLLGKYVIIVGIVGLLFIKGMQMKILRMCWNHLNITGVVAIAIYTVIGYFLLPFDTFKWLGIGIVVVGLVLKSIKGKAKETGS